MIPEIEAAPPSVDAGTRKPASAWRRLVREPATAFGLLIILVDIVVAVGAPVIAPHNPLTLYPNGLALDGAPLPPGGAFPLGTDELGRDVLSRLIYGSQVALTVGILATLLALTVGVLVGLLAGFYRGAVETALMRLTDVMLAFPFVLFVIFVAAVFKPSLTVIILAIGLLTWAPMARIARGQTLQVAALPYVEAARALGASGLRIQWRHILPNVFGPVLAYAFLQIGTNITLEAALSYLGAGPPPPTPDWGAMVAQGQASLITAPWLFFFPGLAIMLTVVAFNMVGDGLQRTFRRR
jgi:peptide/nickel transport system permease protein